jgi:REP element-mobilizing transposase RayT
MARPLRIEFPGALYHITARGNAGQDIFLDARDSQRFLDILAEVATRLRWRCFAYCLMTNHYHLVVETPAPNLAHGMRQLNGRYTQGFNFRHGRDGHLFQGRYKAILVDREPYLKEVCRYVVLNPVRAGLAPDARAWRWSSYRATFAAGQAGGGQRPAAPDWLAARDLLALFAAAPEAAAPIYAGFVAEGAGAGVGAGAERAGGAAGRSGLWDRLEGQIYLGAAGFAEAMRARLGDMAGAQSGASEVPRVQREAPPRPLPAFVQGFTDRREAMARAHLEGGYSQAEVARHFGVHYSTVSRAARRFSSKSGNARPDPI